MFPKLFWFAGAWNLCGNGTWLRGRGRSGQVGRSVLMDGRELVPGKHVIPHGKNMAVKGRRVVCSWVGKKRFPRILLKTHYMPEKVK